jgi:hypothetical protein
MTTCGCFDASGACGVADCGVGAAVGGADSPGAAEFVFAVAAGIDCNGAEAGARAEPNQQILCQVPARHPPKAQLSKYRKMLDPLANENHRTLTYTLPAKQFKGQPTGHAIQQKPNYQVLDHQMYAGSERHRKESVGFCLYGNELVTLKTRGLAVDFCHIGGEHNEVNNYSRPGASADWHSI